MGGIRDRMEAISRGRWWMGAGFTLPAGGSAAHILFDQGPGDGSVFASFTHPVPVLLALAASMWGLWGWMNNRRPLAGAILAGVALGFLALVEDSQWPGEVGMRHGKMLPAAGLWGWALGAGFPGFRGPQNQRGLEGTAGVVGAVYFLAALAKIRSGGLEWVTPGTLQLLLAERAFEAPWPVSSLRWALASQPLLCGTLAISTLLVEGMGPLFLFPRWRRTFAMFITLLHGGVAVGMGFFYLPWVLFVWGAVWEGEDGAVGVPGRTRA